MYNKHKYDEDWSSIFEYDETSPSCLRWKNDRRRGRKLCQIFILAGTPVGSLNILDGYWHVHVFGKMYNAHNIVWTMFNNHQGILDIDHIDGDRANTKISNLRVLISKSNAQNRSKYQSNTSGITGVLRRDIKSRHGFGKYNSYWIAQWHDSEDKQQSKAFSISKLGETGAKDAAISHRQLMIALLNSRGEQYTERHGK